MKSLHLTNAWHGSSGGIGTFYRALLEAAERERQYVRLVVPGEDTRIEDTGDFGRIYTIEAPRAPFDSSYRIIFPHRFLLPRTALHRIVTEERPDLVEVSEKYTMHWFAGQLRTRRALGIRVRPTVVGLSCERMDENVAAYVSRSGVAQAFCRLYMKAVYFPCFDHHVSVSEHTAAELIDASRGHKVRRGIWIASMGVDCARFSPSRRSEEGRRELLMRAAAPPHTRLLLYAGRLAPEKNLSLLINAMEQLPAQEYRLLIAGDGILRAQLEIESRQRGLDHVVFLGHIGDRESLASCYANCDVFVHPNPREPFGIAPLEAMAAGLPLVAPASGGVTSYADAGNSWLAPPTPQAFALAIQSVFRDRSETEQRCLCARRTAEQLAWPVVTSRYLRLYRELNQLTRGQQATLTFTPRIWSTPGDLFGREYKVRPN
ncbi:MAG TPA: glycosyltransferase [Bryobacteraceae bacterium]|nr:glycosyltransferase [Bryobacteraceae bacterium]